MYDPPKMLPILSRENINRQLVSQKRLSLPEHLPDKESKRAKKGLLPCARRAPLSSNATDRRSCGFPRSQPDTTLRPTMHPTSPQSRSIFANETGSAPVTTAPAGRSPAIADFERPTTPNAEYPVKSFNCAAEGNVSKHATMNQCFIDSLKGRLWMPPSAPN